MLRALEGQALLDVGVAAKRRAENGEPLMGWRERPISDPDGVVGFALLRCKSRWLLACRVPHSRFATVELDARVGPQCLRICQVQLVDALGGGDDVRVVEIRKDGLPIPQLPLHLFKRGVLSKREQGGHQRISLFSALTLHDAVGSPLPISPCVGTGGPVELPSVREERPELWAGMQSRKHCLPRNMIIGANRVDGQNCCTRVDFSCSPEDAWQRLSARTSAEAVLVRQARRLQSQREGLRERPPYKPPQNVAYYKGPDAASIRLLQSDDPSNAEGSEGRGWHVGLCKALRGAVQELAIDLVVQEDSEVLVGRVVF